MFIEHENIWKFLNDGSDLPINGSILYILVEPLIFSLEEQVDGPEVMLVKVMKDLKGNPEIKFFPLVYDPKSNKIITSNEKLHCDGEYDVVMWRYANLYKYF